MKKLILLLSLAVIITGCKESSSDNPPEPETPNSPSEVLFSLEDSGRIPKLDRSSSVEGTDLNSDGIRDDIEEYINHNYKDNTQRNAARQLAKAFQSSLLVDTSDLIAVKAVNSKISRADHCIFSSFDKANDSNHPAVVSQELESITTNTKTRLLAYLAFSKALDGTSWAMPRGNTCE